MDKIPKMKPCPFCARIDMEITQFQKGVFSISCKCGAESPSDSKSIPAIVRKWNRRRHLDRVAQLIVESDLWYFYIQMHDPQSKLSKEEIARALKKTIIAFEWEEQWIR